jgi:hypothetical protein
VRHSGTGLKEASFMWVLMTEEQQTEVEAAENNPCFSGPPRNVLPHLPCQVYPLKERNIGQAKQSTFPHKHLREVWPMENKTIFLKCTQKVEVSKKNTPEFYWLYLKAVLLALKEQGVLNDVQVLNGLNMLEHQIRNVE